LSQFWILPAIQNLQKDRLIIKLNAGKTPGNDASVGRDDGLVDPSTASKVEKIIARRNSKIN